MYCSNMYDVSFSFIFILHTVQNSDMMTACDWVEEYRSLSKSQKQGIKSAYARSCDQCQVSISKPTTAMARMLVGIVM